MKDLSPDTLDHAVRIQKTFRKGIDLLRRNPRDRKLLHELQRLVKSMDSVDPELLDQLSELSSPQGTALYIRALIAVNNATEAMARFSDFQKDPRQRELLPTREVAKLLKDARCFEAAETMYWKAICMKPEDMVLMQECIENLLDLAEQVYPEKFSEARKLAEYLYKHYPGSPDTLFAIAQVWCKASRMDRCLPYFREFFKLKPDHAARAGFVFNLNYDEELEHEELVSEHREWCDRHKRLVRCKPVDLKPGNQPDKRLRVGYVSPDLGMHPVGFFAIPVLVEHDPQVVEVFIYSHRNPLTQHDSFSMRLQAAVGEDHWRWIEKESTSSLVKRIAEDRIDILVDLAGHSTNNRLDVFSNRAAPVQVSWLGYPHSTWLQNMDYRLSDNIVEPVGKADEMSSEAIYRMPNGFHALEMEPDCPDPDAPPCLKNGYITFGSFNNINKIGSRTIRLWASLLHAVKDSRLLLKHRTMQVLENREGIRSLFTLEGVHPARVAFKGVTPSRYHHLKAYGQMDIALDPFGYNGTTTTCEALYMGVPVLSLPGDRHASRVSSSLLHRMGLDGWIARDQGHYIRIARHAAENFGILANRRERMRQAYLQSPLADTAGLARDLEQAYRTFWKEFCNATKAEHRTAATVTQTHN